VSGTFTTSDGLRLAYDDAGPRDGHPLLCLAGLTRNMADFEPVLDAFGHRARIVRLDARGRGRSEHDPDWRNYNLVREGRDALELLDHLGIARASILGTSRGGLIALTLGVSHAERLRGAVFVDIGPALDPAGLAQIMSYLGQRPPFASYEDAADRLPEAMAPRFADVPRATWRAHAERVWQEGPDGLELRYDANLREAVLEASATGALPDLWPLLDAFATLPTALIRGANSDLLSAGTAAEMRRRLPGMIFADVPGRGHVPFLDEPGAQAAIAAYLDAAEAGAPAAQTTDGAPLTGW
jgi:pimeloyl-ACP methyl ester carboxylesterase